MEKDSARRPASSTRPLGGLARRVDGPGFSVVHSVQPARLEVAEHAHPNASVCFILSGGFRELGPRGARYRSGDLVVSPPGQNIGLRFDPTAVHCLVIEITDELRNALVHGRSPLELRPTAHREPVLGGMARRVLVELHETPSRSSSELELEEAVQTLCQQIEMRRSGPSSPPPATERALARAVEALHAGYRERIGLSEIASLAGVHRVSLARAFRRRYGRSIGEYVHILRASDAASRMAESGAERSLAEIALASGFADQSHLTRIFKRVYGQPPGAFRRAASIVQDARAATALRSPHAASRDRKPPRHRH